MPMLTLPTAVYACQCYCSPHGQCTSLVEAPVEQLVLGLQVDLVVCYDAHASPIRDLQRCGRTGRQRGGACRAAAGAWQGGAQLRKAAAGMFLIHIFHFVIQYTCNAP